ncbi:MAG: hypothetical protein PHV20_05970 [Bacteroidales bacterium]|nr:hypothetical protein [Bacteroidales bacterium]
MLNKYYDTIIISILWVSAIIGIVFSFLQNTDILIQNYMGYGLLSAVTILKFTNPKLEKILLSVLLLIGSFNVIQFTQSTITTTFSWHPMNITTFSIGIQPLSFSLLIFLLITKFNVIAPILFQFFAADPKIEKERQNAVINKRYDELQNETDASLEEMITNKEKYQIEYVKAAEKIIYERNKKITYEQNPTRSL